MKKIKKVLVALTLLLTVMVGVGTLTSCDRITTWIDTNTTEKMQVSKVEPATEKQEIRSRDGVIDLGTFASDEYVCFISSNQSYTFDARRIYLMNGLSVDEMSKAFKIAEIKYSFDYDYYLNDMGEEYAYHLENVDTAFYFLEEYRWTNNGPYNELVVASDYILSIDEVIDKNAPTIGGSVNVSIDIDNQPSQEEILSHVTAWDDTDGYIPVKVESSTYVQGEMVIGESYIHISATDSAGNKSLETIICTKKDWTAPVITGQNSYDLNYDHDLTLDKIKEKLAITDNVDSNLILELVSDNFTGNEHKLGNYQVVFKTKDLSNNVSANFTIDLAVKNKGTATITTVSKITIPTSQLFTLEELKSKISVIDGYDGVIEDYIITGFDDYTKTAKEVGTNIITISYTNSGGNTATAYIEFVKEDNIPPIILFDSYFILLKQGETLTDTILKEHVAKVLSVALEDIVSVVGYYDTNTLGNYELKVALASGENQNFRLAVVNNYSYGNGIESEDNYWEVLWNETRLNLWNFGGWTWLNWTIFCGASGIVLLTIVIVFKVKKKNKDLEDYDNGYRY